MDGSHHKSPPGTLSATPFRYTSQDDEIPIVSPPEQQVHGGYFPVSSPTEYAFSSQQLPPSLQTRVPSSQSSTSVASPSGRPASERQDTLSRLFDERRGARSPNPVQDAGAKENTNDDIALERILPSTKDRYSSYPPAQSLAAASAHPPLRHATEPVYQIPRAPSPPRLPQPVSPTSPRTTAQGRSGSQRAPSGPTRSPSILEGARRSLVGRMNSLRSPSTRTTNSSRRQTGPYQILEEVDEAGKSFSSAQIREAGGSEHDVGIDLTFLEGPHGVSSTYGSPSSAETRSKGDIQREGSFAAEYYQLEESTGFTSGTDNRGTAGPILIFNSPQRSSIAAKSDSTLRVRPKSLAVRRGLSIRDVGHREAEKRNEIVAIEEYAPGMDVTFHDPNDDSGTSSLLYQHRLGSSSTLATGKQSYYFPPEPEKPNWNPFPMRWPWISFLIFLSLAFAGLQFFLLVLSNRRSHQLPPKYPDGPYGLIRFKHPKDLSYIAFFAWKYMPTLISVTYGVMWQIVDFEVKRLEPYYQLSKPDGALAIESLNMEYLTIWSYVAPFKAIKFRQWAVLHCSLATLLAGGLVPILQSASVIVTPNQDKRKPNSYKYVIMQPVWTYCLIAALLLICVLGCCLLYSLRRKSGLLSDPKGIAGIAAMAVKSHILIDFKGLDEKKHQAIHNRLKHRRYILHKSTLWQGEYLKVNGEQTEGEGIENPHPLMLRLPAGISFISFLLLFAIFIPILMFTPVNRISERNSWLLTAIGTIIKMIWTALECDVRMMEPFYILSRRHATSDVLTLDYSGTIPGWMPIKAFLNGHFLVASVGLAAVLTEVLTVCVTSFSVHGKAFVPKEGIADNNTRYSDEETFKSFWVSFSLAMGILIVLSVVATMVYVRRRHPFLPREPGTIASVLGFIHQSKMLRDFVDTERLNGAEMTEKLRGIGKKYGLGYFRGLDGEDHCGIDEEELDSSYKHGLRFQDAKLRPGRDNWEVL